MYSFSFLQEQQNHNRQVMLDLLWICCTQNSTPAANGEPMEVDQPKGEQAGAISTAMARHVGLLLIELVAPDVIYNGTPWPDEEFTKITVERCVFFL